MITRILDQCEWPRLAETEAADVWQHLDPLKSQVVVVEDEGVIVGCQVLTYVLHAECFWVHPAYRGRFGVARQLWATVRRVAATMGAKTLATAACDDRLERILRHMRAVELPGVHFSMAVSTCQQP